MNARVFLSGFFIAACLAQFGSAVDAQPYLPPQSQVILLSGVPGDLESETAYRDQLGNWLQVIEQKAPEAIVALTDNPESGAAKNTPGVPVFLAATRANFLALTNTLAGHTNPLVVIAWGHAGRQADTPVFHVRGPRITPADFISVARASPSESRWLLFFRGSGTFAAELADERRQIISSDAESAFTSDPIGMSLALKLAREKPDIEFSSLAEQLGAAVGSWYKERNLARVEEPTLWSGKEKPKLLAQTSNGRTLASVSASTNQASNTGSTNLPPAAQLPAYWSEINRVEPQRFPDAEAVTLRRRVSYTLGANPAVSAEQESFIQILTAEGKRFGDFDISYSPPSEDIHFLDCELLRPGDELVRLDPDAIREAREESLGEYQMGRRKFFSLPGVGPGAILHVRYRTEWKEFPLPHISLQIPIGQELPALDSTLRVTVPKGAPFHFGFVTPEAQAQKFPDPEVKQTTYGSSYSWHFDNLPSEVRELLSPPHRQSALAISTFPDWPAFAEWYGRISKLTDEVTPALAARAAELTRETKTEREKVVAVYDYVTSLRYVAVPLGVNSFRPHAAANVLQNQFGDCKDKANLFNTLLHSLQINADLVLVPRFGQAQETIPGFAFNHAISRVTLGSETVWVDTTDDVCRFGLLPPGDPGRKVLVITPYSSSLSQLPPPNPAEHELKIHGEIDCSAPDPSFPARFTAIAQGYADYELRETAQQAKEHAASLPLLASRFRTTAGTFALEKQTTTSVAALDENFTWEAQGSCIGISSQSADQTPEHSNRQSSALSAPFWLSKEWDLALHRRKSPLFLNQGYPITIEQELELRLPSNVGTVLLPPIHENTNAPLRWRIEWKQPQKTKAVATFRAELTQAELSPEQTRAFQQQLRSLYSALANPAAFGLH